MRKRERIFTLNEPNAPRLNPSLAVEIGLNESLILLQIEFWISITDNVHDGRYWTYQSVRDIREKAFPFWSISTINRAINSLINEGYLIEGNYNKHSYDKTRWFALNPDKLKVLKSISFRSDDTRVFQNDTRSNQNDTRSNQNDTTIPEITSEITTDTKDKGQNKDLPDMYISFFEYLKTQDHVDKEKSNIINYFLATYNEHFDKPHRELRKEQWDQVVNSLFEVVDQYERTIDIDYQQIKAMIEVYFQTDYKNCDYSLLHFNDERVKEILYYKQEDLETEDYLIKEEQDKSDIKRVFEHWNSIEVITQRSLSKRLETNIKHLLGNYSIDEVLKTIDNYKEVIDNDKYYYNHRMTLQHFIADDNFILFTDENNPFDNFIDRDNKPRRVESFDWDDFDLSDDNKPKKLNRKIRVARF